MVELLEVVSPFLPGIPDFSPEHEEVTVASMLLDSIKTLVKYSKSY